jgi:hypothetical protein
VPSSSLPPYIATNMRAMFMQVLRELELVKEDDDKREKGSDEGEGDSAEEVLRMLFVWLIH